MKSGLVMSASNSFLALNGLHVFITGAGGDIGSCAVREFLGKQVCLGRRSSDNIVVLPQSDNRTDQGCKVTAHDLHAFQVPEEKDSERYARLRVLTGDISDEASIQSSFSEATKRFGPVNVLIANAGVTDESNDYPIWDIPVGVWEKTNKVNVRGTFLTVKHFLRAAQRSQQTLGKELDNLTIVITGSETGKIGQEGHGEYASGMAGLQYGLVRDVKNEIVRLNGKARINTVAPGVGCYAHDRRET